MGHYMLWQETVTVSGGSGEVYQQFSNPIDVGAFSMVKVVPYVYSGTQGMTISILTAVRDNTEYYKTAEDITIPAVPATQPEAIVLKAEHPRDYNDDHPLERFLRWKATKSDSAWELTLEIHVLGYEAT